MQTSKRTGYRLVPTAFVLAAFATVGNAGANPGLTPRDCEQYRGTPTHGYCISQAARHTGDMELADSMCQLAGKKYDECRSGWVWSRIRDPHYTTRALLEFCDDAADCAFVVADARPEGNVIEQVQRCEDWTGPFKIDCAGHALQRWAVSKPAPAEVAAVMAIHSEAAPNAAWWVGIVGACSGQDYCPAVPRFGENCRAAQAQVQRDPALCLRGPTAIAAPTVTPPTGPG
jgi:hypothetical protein